VWSHGKCDGCRVDSNGVLLGNSHGRLAAVRLAVRGKKSLPHPLQFSQSVVYLKGSRKH